MDRYGIRKDEIDLWLTQAFAIGNITPSSQVSFETLRKLRDESQIYDWIFGEVKRQHSSVNSENEPMKKRMKEKHQQANRASSSISSSQVRFPSTSPAPAHSPVPQSIMRVKPKQKRDREDVVTQLSVQRSMKHKSPKVDQNVREVHDPNLPIPIKIKKKPGRKPKHYTPLDEENGIQKGTAEKNKMYKKYLEDRFNEKIRSMSHPPVIKEPLPVLRTLSKLTNPKKRENENRRIKYAYNKECIRWYERQLEKLDAMTAKS